MMLDVPVNKIDIRVIRDAIDSIIVGVVVRFARSVIVIVLSLCVPQLAVTCVEHLITIWFFRLLISLIVAVMMMKGSNTITT
jgi:hypothetical protein